MNRNELLDALKSFTEEVTKDLLLPTRVQSLSDTPSERAPLVYKMRLPDSKSAQKKAPYVLHQLITGNDVQHEGEKAQSSTTVRSIICTYCEDEQEGALALLNVAERIRIGLLRKCVIGDRNQYWLNLEDGVDFIAYPDDTAPYFAGEIVTVWHMPPVQREVPEIW